MHNSQTKDLYTLDIYGDDYRERTKMERLESVARQKSQTLLSSEKITRTSPNYLKASERCAVLKQPYNNRMDELLQHDYLIKSMERRVNRHVVTSQLNKISQSNDRQMKKTFSGSWRTSPLLKCAD